LYTAKELSKEEENNLMKRAIHLGLDLKGGMHLVLEVDTTGLREKPSDLRDRALEIVKNRIDEFGVFEPTIEKQGSSRIIVQLPGVDRERALNIIRKVAHLEFKLVSDKTQDVIKSIDRYLAKGDTMGFEEPFSSYLFSVEGDIGFDVRDEDSIKALIAKAQEVIPKDLQFYFGPKETQQGRDVKRLYLLKKEPELSGETIRNAQHAPYQGTELQYTGAWMVEIEFKREAARLFASVTGRNVGKRLAIVLDDIVQSAPYIRERIPQGKAVITGNFKVEEARDLAIVLRAGALPAPLKIVEERSVGPSLGKDSIIQGIRASLIGSLFVVVFMLVYYSLTGLVANFALVLNVILLIGILSAFGGTLTMPGIAGIALTIAMSVDANILIFERIKEELKFGKTVRTAIAQGFSRAWLAIFDSNVTTIITGIVLYIFGTGPIKGFALTLIIGLIANLICAVLVTKTILDYFTYKFEVKKLRI
ncbi:MAG: protein translocase subunit SecD, partial [candidate division WOR-3 bacterium]|nr:protein translocase subunit SecD [candidate division WOR-3 bacterium]